ncbi:hypothetical protein BJX64DRAFT_29939 [Aspergillus heterothallicus]
MSRVILQHVSESVRFCVLSVSRLYYFLGVPFFFFSFPPPSFAKKGSRTAGGLSGSTS